MGAKDFFRSLFGNKDRFTLHGPDAMDAAKDFMSRAVTETSVRELAINVAINMIANTVSKCEVKTFASGAEYKGDEHYLWNIKPNANENGTQFMRRLIYRLCFDGEALVIFDRAYSANTIQALVADSFALKTDLTLYAKTYTNVSVGDLSYDRDFGADEVLYLQLNNEDIKRLVDRFYNSYKQLIDMSHKAFRRSRGERGVLKVDRLQGDTTYEKTVQSIMDDYMKPYFQNENAVLPLPEGQDYTRLSATSSRELTETAEVRKLINDVFDITAIAFGIPPSLMRGEMADTSNQMTNFLTFCIGPVCNLIATEINAKRYSREEYKSGTYVKIDTSSVKHVDLFDVATAVDKLVSSGATSINEVRKALGLPRIDEEWADEHFITKNYQRIIDALEAAAEGGDEDAKQVLRIVRGRKG